MHEDFITRHYCAADYPDVIKIWEDTGMGGPERGDNERVIQQTFDTGGFMLLLVETSTNTVVGTSWVTLDGRRAYLHHFGISPVYQGLGLSKILLDDTMILLRKTGLQAKLEVHQKNHIAVELYEKYGFKYLGDYDVYIIRDIDNV